MPNRQAVAIVYDKQTGYGVQEVLYADDTHDTSDIHGKAALVSMVKRVLSGFGLRLYATRTDERMVRYLFANDSDWQGKL